MSSLALVVLVAEAEDVAQPVGLALDAPPSVAAEPGAATQLSHALDRIGHRQQALHAREVDAQLVYQVLDQPEALQFLARVDAHAAIGACRLHQAEALVFPERLGVHPEQPRGAADEVELPGNPHETLLQPATERI